MCTHKSETRADQGYPLDGLHTDIHFKSAPSRRWEGVAEAGESSAPSAPFPLRGPEHQVPYGGSRVTPAALLPPMSQGVACDEVNIGLKSDLALQRGVGGGGESEEPRRVGFL